MSFVVPLTARLPRALVKQNVSLRRQYTLAECRPGEHGISAYAGSQAPYWRCQTWKTNGARSEIVLDCSNCIQCMRSFVGFPPICEHVASSTAVCL
ncbi:hypothetical protein BDA96_02G380500 [Sorghum bicolor]|uniref:Uncharacterized protein n=1 Tax=Sorghum bicolor TaxID=4558 RepID=A0A921RS56_SORBI|nr:hypothetical protein BDA96_02G380500 [Sorghum bicolor]